MDAPNPTVSNSALWGAYLSNEWGGWIAPAGLAAIPLAIGASIASAQALWLEAIIGRLYADNADQVTRFVERVDEVKREAALRSRADAAAESVPSWLTASDDAPVEEAHIGSVLASV